MENYVIAHVDKTVIKIKGLKINGMKPFQLEEALNDRIKRQIRVIGVTGNSIDMDVYGLEPEAILKDEEGIINTISTIEGVKATEVAKIYSAKKALEVELDDIPIGKYSGCAKERWINFDK